MQRLYFVSLEKEVLKKMSAVGLPQKSYQIEDRAMEGYAMAYRAYLARRDLPGPEPTFADFVEIRKMQERIEGLSPADLPIPYESQSGLIDGSFLGIAKLN